MPNKLKKKKKREEKRVWTFVQKLCAISPFSFLFILGRKFFCGSWKKTVGPHHLFFFLPTQPSTLQKNLHSHFLSKVFYPSYFIFKQTHPEGVERSWGGLKSLVKQLRRAHVKSNDHNKAMEDSVSWSPIFLFTFLSSLNNK